MSEAKNNFTGSKMNKDVSPRLIPNNQYIDARNAAVLNSEGGDSGVLENVTGNSLLTNLNLTGENLEIIGFYLEGELDRIFLFVTNWNDTSQSNTQHFASPQSSHYICMYDTATEVSTTLVSGSFLNFSKTNEILGINILEDLLFFTDNRNQPRKINISLALENPAYYTTEDTISILKYFPWKAPRLSKNIVSPGKTNQYELLQRSELIISKPGPITTIPDNTVIYVNVNTDFNPSPNWTTSGNGQCQLKITFVQNRVSQVLISDLTGTVTSKDFSIGDTITSTDTSTPSTNGLELTIGSQNIARVPTMEDVTSENLPITQLTTVNSNITNTSFVGSASPHVNWIGAILTSTDASGNSKITVSDNIKVTNTSSTTVTHTSTTNIAVGDIITIGANPYYNSEFTGDKDFLNDKFIRFSYRFKFEDNEYSLIAPFTQSAFIPKQDGYFLEQSVPTDIEDEAADSDENRAIRSGILGFFENKVDSVGVTIELPEGVSSPDKLYDELKVTEIEILYKDSNDTGIRLIDTITKDDLVSMPQTNEITYSYDSQMPIRTLRSVDFSRASDKAPIRAKSQEVAGNRVIYGNYLARTTRPTSLSYAITADEKFTSGTGNSFNQVEYPNHTLKQNRSYEVGIVLSDKFGRQSDVITSNLSSTFNPYKDQAFVTNPNGLLYWMGDSLKVNWLSKIPDTIALNGYAGLYSDTNPLGWYSYKVVVKQTAQDYYNIYLPTILNNYPQTGTNTSNEVAFITLFSDNVNKAPRDLLKVSAGDVTFTSSVEMYGRVSNSFYSSTNASSTQYYPSDIPDKLVKIATRNDLGLNFTQSGGAYTVSPFYSIPKVDEKGSNPFIGEVSTRKTIGARGGSAATNKVTFNAVRLNVYETAPFESNLDIYYESSSSGLISEINSYISQDQSIGAPANIKDWTWQLSESDTSTDVSPYYVNTGPWDVVNNEGTSLTAAGVVTSIEGVLLSVTNANNANVNSSGAFVLEQITSGPDLNKFRVKLGVNNYFIYNSSSSAVDIYTFNFRFTTVKNNITYIRDIAAEFGNELDNTLPSLIGSQGPFSIPLASSPYEIPTSSSSFSNLYTLTPTNGSSSPTGKMQGITVSVESVEYKKTNGQYAPYITYEEAFNIFYGQNNTVPEYLDFVNTQSNTTILYNKYLQCVDPSGFNLTSVYSFSRRTDTEFRITLRLNDASNGNGTLASLPIVLTFTLLRLN